MVEGDHGAANYSDVHDVPVVPQVRPGMQKKPAIQDLNKSCTNAVFTYIGGGGKTNYVVHLEADFTSKSYCEDVVCLAEPVVPWVVLVHRVLGCDGEAGEHDHDHDKLVEGRSTHEPVYHFTHTEIIALNILGNINDRHMRIH